MFFGRKEINMDSFKDIRWKQRFENFEKTYKLLEKYSHQDLTRNILMKWEKLFIGKNQRTFKL